MQTSQNPIFECKNLRTDETGKTTETGVKTPNVEKGHHPASVMFW